MDPVERELRDTLADDRLSMPARHDATSLLHAGVRRRRRHRAIATMSAVVVLVAGGATATSLAIASGTGTERIVSPVGGGTPTPAAKPRPPAPVADEVPWAPIGYDYRRPPVFPGTAADPSVPWCHDKQLTLSQSLQGASGNLVGTVSVANTSSSPCALQGQPAVRIVAADDTVLVSSVPEPFYVDAWVRVKPGATASAGIQWMQQYCGHDMPARIAIGLPHGGGSLSVPFTGRPVCDSLVPTTSRLVVGGFLAREGSPFTPEAGLSAHIDRTGTSVVPGATLDYRLQLQSMDAPNVALAPCLPFRERLVNEVTHVVLVEEDHLLNCDAAPAEITDPASRHETYFDMQVTLPADVPPGDYALVWQSVLRPVAAVADEVVHVSAAPPPCQDGQLTASAGATGAAMQQYFRVVVLRNVSATACTLRGYPGVQLAGSDGAPIGRPAGRGGGYAFPDPPAATVVLPARTGTASFSFGGGDYDVVNERPCTTAAYAWVYPPGLRHRLSVPLTAQYCPSGLDVARVVAGASGDRY